MLLGRAPERQALMDVLERARRGESAVLVLAGEAGIGKTALLDLAAELATGMQVLRARGVESEARVLFGGLLELLRPALGALDRIPEPQAEALGGALALRPGGARDRFAVGAATLSVLAATAEEQPLLVLVDDVQWLDASSAEALVFAVRRLLADPVAVILATRDGAPSPLDGAGLPTLRVTGLGREDAAALLAQSGTSPLGDDVVERLYHSTAGNPLALIELAPEAPRLASAPVDTPVPVVTSVAQAFADRLEALPERTRQLVLLAAAAGGGDVATLVRAGAARGLDLDDLGPAEDVGLVTVAGGTLEFRHPLVRSAAYASASAQERRGAHRALADALPDREADRRAWHLAAAAVGPDESASVALAQAAERARERSAYTVAAAAFERAARLDPTERRRAELLRAAADAAWVAGLADKAVQLLEEARHDADTVLQVAIDHLRGHIAVRQGRILEGYALLVSTAERTAARDPEAAAIMFAEASNACVYLSDVARMLEAAERAHALVPDDDGSEASFYAVMAHGMALIMAGDAEGAALLRRGVAQLESSSTLRSHPNLLSWAVMGPLFLRETESSRHLVELALSTARGETALGVLPFLLMHVARDHASSHDWTAAGSEYHEGIRLARETGQQTDLAALLAGLASLEARQGREEAARAHAAEARTLAATVGFGLPDIWALLALGDLELGLGRADAAAAHLEELDRFLHARGVADVDVFPAPELAEAYVRLGRSGDARGLAGELEARAEAKGLPWSLARAARTRGLLADEDEIDHWFTRALELHAQTPDVFAGARTRLIYGERLRRARRRADARPQLRQALEDFERLGASPWAELARAELAATGETARRRELPDRDRLTPQELQIGLLLSDGRTTREAAAAMFLSPKTIEYHQRNLYRKLDVRSRVELVAAMRALPDVGD